MSTQTQKCLTGIRSDFERGVFLSVYNSRVQRMRRVIALLILGLKHGLRGILVRGVREDYADHVEGFILRPGYPGRLLVPGIFIS